MVYDNWHILRNDTKLNAWIATKLAICYRKSLSLRDILTRSHYQKQPNTCAPLPTLDLVFIQYFLYNITGWIYDAAHLSPEEVTELQNVSAGLYILYAPYHLYVLMFMEIFDFAAYYVFKFALYATHVQIMCPECHYLRHLASLFLTYLNKPYCFVLIGSTYWYFEPGCDPSKYPPPPYKDKSSPLLTLEFAPPSKIEETFFSGITQGQDLRSYLGDWRWHNPVNSEAGHTLLIANFYPSLHF